jgi:hypothetical protein
MKQITVPLQAVLPGLSPLPWKSETLTGFSRRSSNGILWAHGWNPELRPRQYLDFDFTLHAVNNFPQSVELLEMQLRFLNCLPAEQFAEIQDQIDAMKTRIQEFITKATQVEVVAETVIDVRAEKS